jgi:hypothetical protein
VIRQRQIFVTGATQLFADGSNNNGVGKTGKGQVTLEKQKRLQEKQGKVKATLEDGLALATIQAAADDPMQLPNRVKHLHLCGKRFVFLKRDLLCKRRLNVWNRRRMCSRRRRRLLRGSSVRLAIQAVVDDPTQLPNPMRQC